MKIQTLPTIILLFLIQPAISQTTRVTNLQTLPVLSPQQLAKWNQAQNQLGVMGSDFDGKDEIGTAPTERVNTWSKAFHPKSGYDYINFWYPNIRPSDNRRAYKQTLLGKVDASKVEQFENSIMYPDYDINIFVEPLSQFQFLIDENPRPDATALTKAGYYKSRPGKLVEKVFEPISVKNYSFSQPEICNPKFTHIEVEIDLNPNLVKQFLASFKNDYPGTVGCYGAWINDLGHCKQPEIHPAEQIWWRDNRHNNVQIYKCNLVCDYSKRFMWDGLVSTDESGFTKMKAWAYPPIIGLFAFPFEIKAGGAGMVHRIIVHSAEYANALSDKNISNYHLVVGMDTLISVYRPPYPQMNISFEEIGTDPGGNIKGFVVVKSAVGLNVDNNDKLYPGHLFFEMKTFPKSDIKNSSGKYSVTLESIECVKKDDYGDEEDLFGNIYVNAYFVNFGNEWKETELTAEKFSSNFNSCTPGRAYFWCIPKPTSKTSTKPLYLKQNSTKTIASSAVFNFPSSGYIKVTGDIDEWDPQDFNIWDPKEDDVVDALGETQKNEIYINEIGSSPLKFFQFFASGGTIVKANFSIQKVF